MKRKIAANYIFLAGYPLVKNGYVVCEDGKEPEVIDTGGVMKEIQGLEFYGGMIVPAFVCSRVKMFRDGENLLPVLEAIYSESGGECPDLAIIEGAELRHLKWKAGGTIRLLR